MLSNEIKEEIREAIQEAVTSTIASLRSDRVGYTLKEAAEKVGLPRNTFRNAICRGELRAVKRGKQWMVSHEALIKWLTPKG